MLPNEYMAFKDYEQNRLPPGGEEARKYRLLRDAGLTRQSRLAPLGRWMLTRLASLLVLTGTWLERRAAPAPR